MNEHLVAHPQAAVAQPRGQAMRGVEEFSVGPLPAAPLGRIPDQGRVVGLVGGPVLQQPRDVLAVHLHLVERGAVHRWHPVAVLCRSHRQGSPLFAKGIEAV